MRKINLLEAQDWVQNINVRQNGMCRKIDEFIRSKKYGIREYQTAVLEIPYTWPMSMSYSWTEQLTNMFVRSVPFGDGYYGFFSGCAVSKCNDRIKEILYEKIEGFAVDSVDAYDIDGFGEMRRAGTDNFIVFMKTEDNVIEFYHRIVRISIFCYYIMEEYYRHFDGFNQRCLNYFAKGPLGNSRIRYYIDTRDGTLVEEEGIDMSRKEPPETKMCKILTDCFAEFGDYFLKARFWPDTTPERKRIIIDLRKEGE